MYQFFRERFLYGAAPELSRNGRNVSFETEVMAHGILTLSFDQLFETNTVARSVSAASLLFHECLRL